MSSLPITRVVLYKHGVGYFERQGSVEGDAALSLTFKQAEVSDVLKSLTVLDLEGGHIASVSYDSTKPLEQLLAEVALSIPDQGSLVGLLPQIKGARIRVQPSRSSSMGNLVTPPANESVEGVVLGVDTTERQTGDGITHTVLLSLLTDNGEVRSFDLHSLGKLEILDQALRRDLDYYLRTQLSAKKKESRTFTFFAQGQGQRTIRLSYTLEAPVWKATYRILLGEEEKPPLIQGWAVVDNTQDEDWENVQLSLIAGLPVSFVHDLYTPRYIKRPVVAVQETTGVLPPEVEEGVQLGGQFYADADLEVAASPASQLRAKRLRGGGRGSGGARSAESSMPAQVRERKLGDLFEYEIEHPVTIRRNQSALVPIVLRSFEGRPVLLYNKATRAENPMRCVEFKNTTGLTLEGGPVTVLEGGSYVGEAMLETTKPDDLRLVPYAVELAVTVLDNVNSHDDRVHRIFIHQGQLRSDYTHVRQTTFTFNNKGDSEQTVYLEHPRDGKEWELQDPPEPNEITENHWRFRFLLPGKKVTHFVVQQHRMLYNLFVLGDITDHYLSYWIEQRYLDARTERVLRLIVQLRQQAATLEEQIKRLEKERETIHGEQKAHSREPAIAGRSFHGEGPARALCAYPERPGRSARTDRTRVAAEERRARSVSRADQHASVRTGIRSGSSSTGDGSLVGVRFISPALWGWWAFYAHWLSPRHRTGVRLSLSLPFLWGRRLCRSRLTPRRLGRLQTTPDTTELCLEIIVFFPNIEELVQAGDFEDFVNLRIDIAEDQTPPHRLQLFVQGDEFPKRGAGEEFDITEVEQDFAPSYLIDQAEELFTNNLDVLLIEDALIDKVHHGHVADVFYLKLPVPWRGHGFDTPESKTLERAVFHSQQSNPISVRPQAGPHQGQRR